MSRARERWADRRFLILTAAFVLIVTAPALLQFIRSDGYLYYRNGADEPFYLQYDVSVRNQGISRPGQFLVTALHLTGLSGGAINLLCDLTLPVAFLFLIRAIGRRLGLPERAAAGGAFLLLLGPLAFTAANPLLDYAFRIGTAQGWIRFIAMPDGAFLPMLRSPEPQVSFVMLGLAVLLALRRRSFIPVYLVLPFLYPLLALPAGFVTIGLTVRSRLDPSRPTRGAVVGAVTAFLVLSVGAGVMRVLVVNAAVQQHLLPSHLPYLSLTSAAAMAGWLALRRRLEPDLRVGALLVALAPLASSNTQVITGWLVAPIEMELYAGSACAALLCGGALFATAAPGTSRSWWARRGQQVAVATMFVLCARVMTSNVRDVLATPVLDPQVLDALRADAGRVVWSDGRRARLLSLVFPRQARLALDFGQTYTEGDPAGSFDRYLAVRGAILDDPRAPQFRELLSALDAGYTHDNEGQLFSTSGRSKTFETNRDVAAEAARHSRRATDLIYLIERTPGRLERDR